MRGGTSKGPFLDLRDLPSIAEERDEVLLRLMGSPDKRQIDGIGGATFVTSKVVMVRPSERPNIDVDYLFAQVSIEHAAVDTRPTCLNLMSGVAPFAIERGWIKARHEETTVRVYNINTDSTIDMIVQTPNGQVNYSRGNFVVDGVPGCGSPILMRMKGIEGGATGRLFPSGNLIDEIEGIQATLFDAGNLMVHLRGSDFGLTGEESGEYFESRLELMHRLERIRCTIAAQAGMGNVSKSVLPKVGLLFPPILGGHIRSQYFTPRTLHPTHAVSGAVSVTASALCTGTIAAEMVRRDDSQGHDIILEHQAGKIPVELHCEGQGLNFRIHSAGAYRTARKLFDGYVYY